MTELTASLPMYNLPEMAPRNTAFWKALSEEISEEGFANRPVELSFSRSPVPDAIGQEVLFSQTCGYPLQTVYRGQFALLGAPTYDFPGCGVATHRAFIIVRKDSSYRTVEDLRAQLRGCSVQGSERRSNPRPPSLSLAHSVLHGQQRFRNAPLLPENAPELVLEPIARRIWRLLEG